MLARAERAAVGEHRDDVAEHVVGDGEQQQVAGPGDVGRLARADAGQQRRRSGRARRRTRRRRRRPRGRRRAGQQPGRRRRGLRRRRRPQGAWCVMCEPLSFQSLRPPAPAVGGARAGVGTGRYARRVSTTTCTAVGCPSGSSRCDDVTGGHAHLGQTGPVTRPAPAAPATPGPAPGRPTSSGRGACGSQSWVTWSTMCTPAGAVISCTPGGHLAVLERVEDRPLAALALVAVARRERRRVGPVRELVAVEVLQLHAQPVRQADRADRLGRGADLPLVGLGEDEVRPDREAPLLGVAQPEVEVALGRRSRGRARGAAPG